MIVSMVLLWKLSILPFYHFCIYQTLLDSRVKPWVNKKITEYIGEEEPTLTDFICQKVITRSSAQSILTDVAMVRKYPTLFYPCAKIYFINVNWTEDKLIA